MLENIAAAILILLTGVQAQHSVVLPSQYLCAVIGSTQTIPCEFTTPDYSSVIERQWYRIQSSDGEPQVLDKDPQYKQRISVNTNMQNCELKLQDIRLSDSGVYNFRFRTKSTDWSSAAAGVYLSVTDLQVKVDPVPGQNKVILTCSSNCSPKIYTHYVWYRYNQHFTYGASIKLDSTRSSDVGSYSCQMLDSSHRAPAVCVSANEENCWSVSYSSQSICTLIGSSVEIFSYYTFPNNQKVRKLVWFTKEQVGGEPVDLRDDEDYQDRVQYTEVSHNQCTLQINNLRESDSQMYMFRFYSDGGGYANRQGVTLSVTDLQVSLASAPGKRTVTLSCITSCTLPNNLTYIWYRNGHRVIQCKSASCTVAAVSGEISYRCAVEVRKSFVSPPVYSPKNTSAVVLPARVKVEGDSVSLSCSSDANPPVHTYSWFKQTVAADALLITDQTYNITNISSEHGGFYYCTAQNELGRQNSTPIHLVVQPVSEKSNELWKQYALWAAVTVILGLALCLLPVILCMMRKRGAGRDLDVQSDSTPNDMTYTPLNVMTRSLDCDVLHQVRGGANDTYSSLNPATMSSHYDTLEHVRGSDSNTYLSLNPATMSSHYDTLRGRAT